MNYYRKHGDDIDISQVEGFIRQIIGWREFMRGIYQNYDERLEKNNFFNHKRKMKNNWYKGNTGLPPLDHAISNAVNYNDKPIGFVKINCIEEADKYIFTVKDNGQGIAKEHQEKMFNSFQSFTKMKGSTGLGLSIVKHIMEAHQQTVHVRSSINMGSTFGFTLEKA
mgnify:CR=1 FL=1